MTILLRGQSHGNDVATGTELGPVAGLSPGDAMFVKCRANLGPFTEQAGWDTRSMKVDGNTAVWEYIATRIATGGAEDTFIIQNDVSLTKASMWVFHTDDDSPLAFDINAGAVAEPFDFIQATRSNSSAWAGGSFTFTSPVVAEVVFVEGTSGSDGTPTGPDGWTDSSGGSTGHLYWRTVDPAAGDSSNPTVDWSGSAYGPLSHFALAAAEAPAPDSDGEDSDADAASDAGQGGGTGATAAEIWNYEVEPGYTAADLLRICAAVLAGRTTITNHGGGAATVEFRSITDDHVVLSVEMLNSERVTTTANP